MIRLYGLPENEHIFFAGSLPEYRRIYQTMIAELLKCPPFYEQDLALQMQHLLILVGRQLHERPEKRAMNEYTRAAMENSVSYFDSHYPESIYIEDFAAKKGMSISWFIRSFREFTGMTPRQYIIRLRIANAEELLTHSDRSIGEIASIVGFDNALYFSRLFHKSTGMSPSSFREEAGGNIR